MDNELLKQKQALPLDAKIQMTIIRIRHWYRHWKGKVYVSFSGGKDSTVLLHIARSIYPRIKAVYFNTGIEFPEINEFVKGVDNVEWVKPSESFKAVIEKHGYPVVSKEVSQKIHEIRTTKSVQLYMKRMHGDNNKYKSGKLPDKWKRLIDAPFKISHKCCDVMKKRPAEAYTKRTGLQPIIGTMASDSHLRHQQYVRNGGCNAYNKKPSSRPMSFWKEEDIWEYIKQNNVEHCPIYNMGYRSTGCVFCAFGAHREDEPNRFQRMKETHPHLYRYCMDKLNLDDVLNFIDIPH